MLPLFSLLHDFPNQSVLCYDFRHIKTQFLARDTRTGPQKRCPPIYAAVVRTSIYSCASFIDTYVHDITLSSCIVYGRLYKTDSGSGRRSLDGSIQLSCSAYCSQLLLSNLFLWTVSRFTDRMTLNIKLRPRM